MHLLRHIRIKSIIFHMQQTRLHVSLIQKYSPVYAVHGVTVCSSFQKRFAGSMFSKTLTHSEKKVIRVPIEVMYDVVADVDQYKDFVPWCTKSITTTKTKKTAKAQLSVGFGPVTEHYNSTLVCNRPYYLKSICTDGKLFNMLECTWRFAEGKTPKSCVISFDVSFEFRSLMYTKLAKVFFDEVAKKMVVAFEVRAKQQHMLKTKLS